MNTEVTAGADAPESVEAVAGALAAHGYLADEGLATSIFLSLALRRPLLLEGEAGVGKTEVAKVLAAWSGAELIRLQCYEGIDVSQAVYEWDYARQLLHLRAAEIAGATRPPAGAGTDHAGGTDHSTRADHASGVEATDAVYSERFLVRRALLSAVDHGGGPPPVLLIDEIDRADDEFEAFLLEILSEYAVTVPELGTFRAAVPPRVVITSNRTRDVHDALKRRCLYHWVPHPDFEREVEIVALRAPQAVERLVRQVAGAVESLRGMHLYKPPGVAETIDWAAALAVLGRREIDEHAVDVTLGAVVKYQEDQARVRAAGLDELVRAPPCCGGRDVDGVAVADGVTGADRIVVGFARALRHAGLAVPVGSVVAFAEALGQVGVERRDRVYWAGRATLVRRPEDAAVYDRVFGSYWLDRATVLPPTPPAPETTLAVDDGADDPPAGGEDDAGGPPPLVVRWSAVETLRDKDFADYSREEWAEYRRLLARLRWSAETRRTRRRRPDRRRRSHPDLRRTVRRALRSDGEPIERAWRAPSARPRRVVLLVDVSGSMESYARALLRFAHAAVAARGPTRCEVFTLGTRLTRVTRELAQRDPDAALRAAAGAVADWSGGTRLGVGLEEFNDRWGARGTARGAVVVVLSDGWDRGDPAELGAQMARLSRVAHRVVWVNPLKASPGYAPLARGMAAALPYVDQFVEGHSLAALEHLAFVVGGGWSGERWAGS